MEEGNEGHPSTWRPTEKHRPSKARWAEQARKSSARQTATDTAERPDGIDPGAYATLKGMKPFVIVVAAFLGIYAIAHWVIGVV